MGALKYYLQNGAAAFSPTTLRGGWDDTTGGSTGERAMGASKAGASSASFRTIGSAAANYDTFLARFVSEPLATDVYFSGNLAGCIPAYEVVSGLNAQLHLHLFVLQGQTDSLRATLVSDYIDAEELGVALKGSIGEAFTTALSVAYAVAGDTVVLEVGVRCNAASLDQAGVYFGGSGADAVDGGDNTQAAWVSLDCKVVAHGDLDLRWCVACPTPTLVDPTDGGLVEGLFPTLTFGTVNPDSADVHAVLEISAFRDFRSLVVDTDSATDYADWEEAASPFTTWTTVGSGGATAGNRMRYTVLSALRYDAYYGRISLKDASHYGSPIVFGFTVSSDGTAPLSVTIGGVAFNVTACVITEETGGEVSAFRLEVTLTDFRADPLTEGDAIAISSGIGGHGRSWNGTVENWDFDGSAVRVYGVADDAYLSRKICTGDEAVEDAGQNLADFVDDFGAPITSTNVDVATGLDLALTGGYKYLREHCDDLIKALPNYQYWVDETGDLHFVDTATLPYADAVVFEEDPEE